MVQIPGLVVDPLEIELFQVAQRISHEAQDLSPFSRDVQVKNSAATDYHKEK